MLATESVYYENVHLTNLNYFAYLKVFIIKKVGEKKKEKKRFTIVEFSMH